MQRLLREAVWDADALRDDALGVGYVLAVACDHRDQHR